MKTVLTYGTFDLFHYGHLRLLERLAELGDRLVVGVSTDEFNAEKGKRSFISYEHRSAIVAALGVVDEVIPESCWEQKKDDIYRLDVSILGMGSDWSGKFDDLRESCEVVYLPRTSDISSTFLRKVMRPFTSAEVQRVRAAVDGIAELLDRLE